MPQITEPASRDAQREIVRQSLNEIAAEIGVALRDAHLDFPVYVTVPTSGDSLATFACPVDPSDEDWANASRIVCRVIGKRLCRLRLRGRELVCAIANPAMVAAEVSVKPVEACGVAGSTGGGSEFQSRSRMCASLAISWWNVSLAAVRADHKQRGMAIWWAAPRRGSPDRE